MYLEESIERINQKLHVLEGKKNIAIWGAAENTVSLFQYTDISNYNIKLIIDNGKRGSFFWGKTVIVSDEADWNAIDAVVISAFYKENEIFAELIEKYQFCGVIIRLNCEGQKKPFYQYLTKSELQIPQKYNDIIQLNERFYNIHNGERVFIIGNGPSIKNTDLKKLKTERTMVVSNFYMHPDYNLVKPDYYCFAQFTYSNVFTDEDAKNWVEEVCRNAGDPQFFFNITEKRIIDQCECFHNKKVKYLYLSRFTHDEYYEEVNASKKLLMGQTVLIDCIQLAMYMGFKEIYLIGAEHDFIINNSYSYFYDRGKSLMGDKDKYWANKNNMVVVDFQSQLNIVSKMWKDYNLLKRISDSKGISIYNATKGGILDVFDRVDYDLILS